METVRTKIYPSAAVDRIDELHRPEVPFRAYETLVARIKAAIPDEREEQTCVIVQTEAGPQAWYDHALSPVEVLQRDRERLAATLGRARKALPREGEAMTAEQVDGLRRLLEMVQGAA